MQPSRRAAALARLCLTLAAAAAALPVASAVVCSSFTMPAQCNRTTTDAGVCGWVSGACQVVAEIPEGVAAITSIEEGPVFTTTEHEESEAPAPAPEAESMRRGARRLAQLAAQPVLLAPAEEAAAIGGCDDIPTPPYTCAEQLGWGKCGEPWMVAGGFCRRTCGLCAPAEESPAVDEEVPAVAQGPTDATFCTQPHDKGPCRAAIPSWYYDASVGNCRSFIWGGCQGNDNRFSSYESCTAAAEVFCQA